MNKNPRTSIFRKHGYTTDSGLLARMAAQPLEAEEITAFLERSRKILNMVVKG